MAGFTINFWAREEEITRWLQEWHGLETVKMAAMISNPFSVKEVIYEGISEVVPNRDVFRLFLFLSQPELDKNFFAPGDFIDCNPNGLVLDIGHLSEHGLKESWLSCLSEDVGILRKWKRITKHLKSHTLAGVTAINRKTGESGFYRSDRYSNGAKKFEDEGIPILPIQGTNGPIIRLGKVAERFDV